MAVVIDYTWTLGPADSSVTGGGFTGVEVFFPPSYSVLYAECSTIATTQSFAFQTAAHSTGPWVTELSTALPGAGSSASAAVLRLTGPFNWMRPWLNTASTGIYNFRLIGVEE